MLLCDRNNVTEHCYGRRLHMDEDLISKKELLERYGISYGALYRWKRMGLIPESAATFFCISSSFSSK